MKSNESKKNEVQKLSPEILEGIVGGSYEILDCGSLCTWKSEMVSDGILIKGQRFSILSPDPAISRYIIVDTSSGKVMDKAEKINAFDSSVGYQGKTNVAPGIMEKALFKEYLEKHPVKSVQGKTFDENFIKLNGEVYYIPYIGDKAINQLKK